MVAPTAVAVARHAMVGTIVFGLAALVELALDKLPATPSRLRPLPLIVRCLAGAACAYLLVGGPLAAILGVAGALAGSYAGALYRRLLPGLVAALGEDAAALALAALVVYAAARSPVLI